MERRAPAGRVSRPAASATREHERAVAIDGRALGRRGAQTRRRLLDAAAELLETRGIRDLRVVDIARAVGSSPATFYQYFRDVEAAVLALTQEVGNDLAPLLAHLAQPWDADHGLDDARALVAGFVDYWDRHRAVLRTRNLAAQEGDERFRDVRNRTLGEFMSTLTDKIAQSRADGHVVSEMSPLAASAALVALIERMAAFHRELEPIGISRDDLVETTARIIHQTVVGRS
jgi:AcrR family transcriptional regulator